MTDYISTPVVQSLIALQEITWFNPKKAQFDEVQSKLSLQMSDMLDASDRLSCFAPYLAQVFPETAVTNGIIESELKAIPAMQLALSDSMNLEILGRLLMKCDNQLPIAGSIKARGGIYEVLLHAERLALANGLVKTSEDYRAFDSEHFRELFSKHQIYVHCFFAEPTHSPCMVSGMETGLHNGISVQELGIDNQTCADGLAVGRPSAFVGPMMDALLSGVYTVSDDNLYRH